MENRRKYERFKADIMTINGNMLFADVLIIRDISIGGISFKADRRLNIGSEYTLRIEDKEKVIPVKGIVIWSQLSESITDLKGDIVPIYTAGLKFNANPYEIQNEIVQFIERYKKDVNKRINGNNLHLMFNIHDAKTVILEFEKTYTVKEFNPGGMLIEGSQPPEIGSTLSIEVNYLNQEPVYITGKIASCRLIESEASQYYHDIGIEFTNISEVNAEKITEIFLSLNNPDELLQSVNV
jgi:hypothetical protein